MRACAQDKIDIIESLLKHGAKINVKDKSGNTPIEYASGNSPEGLSLIKKYM